MLCLWNFKIPLSMSELAYPNRSSMWLTHQKLWFKNYFLTCNLWKILVGKLLQNYIFLRKLSCATYFTNTYFELQPWIPYDTSFSCRRHHTAMLLLHSTDTVATAAAVLLLPPPCYHTDAATLPPLLCCCHHRAAPSTVVMLPSYCHCHCHYAAATAATPARLPLLPTNCRRRHYLHCEIGLIMKKNCVRWQMLIFFNFLNYSDLT